MNQTITKIFRSFPTDGTHAYHWVNGFDGVTEDLIYKGTRIAKSEEQKRTYCCGLTFEVWFKEAMELNIDLGTPRDVKNIKAEWFVARGGRKGPVDALIGRGLGCELIGLKGEEGDFAQLWRKSGSGHSVIVVEHTDKYLKYWSTQPITNGIGIRTEFFEGVKNPITELFIARAKVK